MMFWPGFLPLWYYALFDSSPKFFYLSARPVLRSSLGYACRYPLVHHKTQTARLDGHYEPDTRSQGENLRRFAVTFRFPKPAPAANNDRRA